jgi:tetratricopeptide (TPR) repeat protein
MTHTDFRGHAVSGATPAALDAFERALASFQSWRTGTDADLAIALADAPEFVMAHVLRAYLHVSSRDPAWVRQARPALEAAIALPANARERLHLDAIAAVLADDYERAKALLGDVLREYPRDVIALQVAHSLDYLTGDLARMGDRVPAVLPAWSIELPGYHAVLAMHAFGLQECGELERAREFAEKAIALEPFDARAHHALVHIFEMTGRVDEGIAWMYANACYWAVDTVVDTHCWWHVALFHLAQGEIDHALFVYDRHVRDERSTALADLIDAASLLWRIHLHGGDTGSRFAELAAAWTPHIDDGFCTFTDMHAMVVFVGAREWNLVHRLQDELEQRSSRRGRYGKTTRQVGLAACRGVVAFGRGAYRRAIGLLRSLGAHAHHIGGSHAQRDVLHLTMSRATERAHGRVANHAASRELRPT